MYVFIPVIVNIILTTYLIQSQYGPPPTGPRCANGQPTPTCPADKTADLNTCTCKCKDFKD